MCISAPSSSQPSVSINGSGGNDIVMVGIRRYRPTIFHIPYVGPKGALTIWLQLDRRFTPSGLKRKGPNGRMLVRECLQKPARCTIPKSDLAIEAPGRNRAVAWRDRETQDLIGMCGSYAQIAAIGKLPKPNRFVETCGNGTTAVEGECHRVDLRFMTDETMQSRLGRHVPNDRGLVSEAPAGKKKAPVSRER